MLRYGYTHVAEFHYLHHDKNGNPYAHLAEMGERMVAAALASGIKITLIPVFYQAGNFGTDPQPQQRRFISANIDEYFKLLEASQRVIGQADHARLGFGVHSLRAVKFPDIVRTLEEGPKELPFHIHVAEQQKEVNECLAFCGKRPMQWLLDNVNVNERFHCVHATHLDDYELNSLASSGGHVVLCPSTEGNLGDGIFRMKEYTRSGGRWSLGTDSHIGLDPLEEFRMLDYRQRLVTNQRNTFENDGAGYMIDEEIESGRKAMGLKILQHFEIGQPMDAIVYDAGTPLTGNTAMDQVLATLVYSGSAARALGTLVDGRWIVKNHEHLLKNKISSDFSKAVRQLRGISG
jgi:formimidoylglutamate deiminase